MKYGEYELTKKHFVVGSLIAFVGLIAACGGDESSGNSDGSSTAPAATATTVPATPSNEEVIALGEKEFGACASCHGADGTGVTGLGKNLVGSEFMTSISDSDLATLIKTGRPTSDPANTTGVDMPPKGGNPALNDEKIDGLVAYIRSIQ